MSSPSDPSAASPASGSATPIRVPSVLLPEPGGCGDKPIRGLKQLFVGYFQGRGMAAGRDPAKRPVFPRLHGAARGRFVVDAGLPNAMRVGVFAPQLAEPPPQAPRFHRDATGALKREAAPKRVQARWLIDASGRSATLARALGAQRITHDRLLASHQRLIGGAATDRDGRTWVEAVPDGWWYSVLLPSGERLIVNLSDVSGGDGAAKRRGLRTGEGLWGALRLAPQLHALCAEHGWRPHGVVQGADAGSTELDYAGGERWLAVGDAALAFDPLSSKEIANALYTGVRAAGGDSGLRAGGCRCGWRVCSASAGDSSGVSGAVSGVLCEGGAVAGEQVLAGAREDR